ESALQEDVDVIGLSILSGSHLELVPEVVRRLRDEDLDAPVVAGGIIPPADAERLRAAGVDGVYTPKDFDLNKIMGEIVDLVAQRAGTPAPSWGVPAPPGPGGAPPPSECAVAVVGGGILGMAVARELLARRPGARLCVLEAEEAIGRHQTGRSSGVIHAGIYYEPG